MSKRIKNNSKKKNVQVGRESRSFFFLFIIFLLMFFLINWLAKIPKNNQDKISTIEASDTDTIPKKLNENMVKVNTISFEKDSYEYIVYECAKKLEIPDKLFRLKVKDNIVNINLPINPNRLDLNFANYLISKELLDKKWILISGEESASERSQKLTFNTPDLGKQFVVNIYYDNSKSYPVERPKIALVITELGDKEFSEISNYLNIPYKLNFAIIPFRKYSNSIYQHVMMYNAEVLINIPMEDINYPRVDHGKHGIEVKFSEREVHNALKEQLKELPSAKGGINYLGSLATTDESIMYYTMQFLKANNLYFIDNLTPISSIAFKVAQQNTLTAFKKNMVLDFSQKNTSLKEKINEIVKIGQSSELIVITIPFYKLGNYKTFYSFCEILDNNGYDIINVSSLDEVLF